MANNKIIRGNGVPIHRRLGNIQTNSEDQNDVKVEYEKRNFVKPSSHGCKAKFNLSDNNSLYRAVERFAVSHGINSNNGPYIVRGYDTDLLRGGTLNIKISSSNWTEGIGDGDDFSPLQKYHVTVRPRDSEGNTIEKTPLDALSVTINPQIPGLVTSSGREYPYPYPNCTLVHVDSTHVTSTDEFIHRANDVLQFVFGYEISQNDVVEDSGGIMKLEMYHRINKRCEGVLKSVLQDSQSLLDDQVGIYKQKSKLEFSSRYWHRLGFPEYLHGINLKLYYANISDKTDGPLKHLKFEAQFRNNSDNKLPSFEQFGNIQNNLIEILNSHLLWATVGLDDLIADKVYHGVKQPNCTWVHPKNSREVLKQTAENLYSEVYHEINKTRTTAPKDILLALVKDSYSLQTYDDLENSTGLVKSTIRKHVSRLEEKGIVTRVRSSLTMIDCKNKYVSQVVILALNDSFPEETAKEINQRAKQNKQRREGSTYVEDTELSDDLTKLTNSSKKSNNNANYSTGEA